MKAYEEIPDRRCYDSALGNVSQRPSQPSTTANDGRNAQAKGMTGDARKNFMSARLSGGSAESKKPHCVNGKPCGDTCIAKDKVCHQ